MIKVFFLISILLFSISCSFDKGFSRNRNYDSNRRFINEEDAFSGICSYYGKKFHGRKTANGETFDMYALTAAHRELPFGTKLEIENINNNKKVIVRINDRGPFVKNRVLDLSYGAAETIDMIQAGTAEIVARIIYRPDTDIE